jgi:hypothetical protein
MAKKGKDEKAGTTTTTKVTLLASKIEARKRQSERDHAAAISAEDYVPGRRKTKVEFKDRCRACTNPSAAVRRKESELCTRCQGESVRSRARQAARNAKDSQPQPSAARGHGRPLSPLAQALTSAA